MHHLDSVISNSNVQPRPYQKRICTKVVDILNGTHVDERTNERLENVSSVMVESPTGSGKTVMALLSAKTLEVMRPDYHFGWVSMRRNLLRQAARENVEKGINVRNIDFVSMFDQTPDSLIHAKRAGKRVCLIVDECQHDAASSMANLHNLIEPDQVIGMSATPFRADKMKLCFQKVIKDCGIHQLIQEGYLSQYHHYTIPEWEPNCIADHYCLDPDRWGKSIFFFQTIDECYAFSNILTKRGVANEVVRGGQQKITDNQLERFENGEFQCLINCMVLTEGFDCPALKTAWIRDSSKGPTMQMGGRAFRKYHDLPYKQIVQSVHTKWPFIKTALPLQQWVWTEDDWRSLKINPKINDINMNALKAIATIEVELPHFIMSKRSKKKAIQQS